MLVARLSVCAVSGFRETLTDHTNANRLVSKSIGSYRLQQSRQLCLTAECQSNRYNNQGTTVRGPSKTNDDVKVLQAKLAQKDKEIDELRTAIRSILGPLNDLVKQRPKRKAQSQSLDGEKASKKPRITPSNNNSGHDNNQKDQIGYNPAVSAVADYFHH